MVSELPEGGYIKYEHSELKRKTGSIMDRYARRSTEHERCINRSGYAE